MENRPGTIPNFALKKGTGRVLLDALAEGVLRSIAFLFLFSWWLMRWSVATVLLLAVMAGAGYYVLNETLRGGTHVEIPDVTLRPITEAYYLLASKGLESGEQKMVPDNHVPKYCVISQRPAPGKG